MLGFVKQRSSFQSYKISYATKIWSESCSNRSCICRTFLGLLQWTQLSRSNSLRRGYRSRQLILEFSFCFLTSQIDYKNLENCFKVKFRKKSVQKVKKTRFFGDLGLPAKYSLVGPELCTISDFAEFCNFWENPNRYI